jgi:hypothetical protein
VTIVLFIVSLVIIAIGAAVRQAAQNASQIRCVACAELIRKEARICRYCRTQQPLVLAYQAPISDERGFRAQVRQHPIVAALVMLGIVLLVMNLFPVHR